MSNCSGVRLWLLLAIGWCALHDIGRAEEPAPTITFVAQWGSEGEVQGQLNVPIGIAINAKDEIYVTEFRNNRVQKFSSQGETLGIIAVEKNPGGIAVNAEGEIFVAALLSHKICVYDDTGKLLREWGKQGKGDGEFDQPGGLALAPDGALYVADQVNRRVQRFKSDGTFSAKWGEYGTAAGQFDGVEKPANRVGGPNFVAVDGSGNVFTTEAAPGRIQKFSPDTQPLLAFGSNTPELGGFGGRPKNLPGPIAVAIDKLSRIWVSSTNNRVQCFSSDGKLLGGLTSLEPGTELGQFNTPHGLTFDSKGDLYVVDTQNHRIQKFKVEN